MKITKPKENQLLIEDDFLKDFKLKVESKTGLNDSKYNELYNSLILGYRLQNMDSSKQLFYGNKVSLMTLTCSMLENLLRNEVINENELFDMAEMVAKVYKNKN